MQRRDDEPWERPDATWPRNSSVAEPLCDADGDMEGSERRSHVYETVHPRWVKSRN